METFEEDKQKIGELSKWARLTGSKDHVGARFNKSTSAPQEIKEAYANIPKSTVSTLFDLYKYDFEMFEYEPNFD